jgi:hypothetical protein
MCLSTAVYGQADDGKGVMMNPDGKYDLLSQLWRFEDADPLDTGTVDLRLGLQWWTENSAATNGESSDNWILTPTLVWGFAENWELSVGNDSWLGDGGDRGAFDDGNYDTNLGLLWRVHEQEPFMARKGEMNWPSMALSTTLRIPTGHDSAGVDAELRFISTYEYTSGVRSHMNIFMKSHNKNNDDIDGNNGFFGLGGGGLGNLVNGLAFLGFGNNNDIDARHFQYGIVLGADGPLPCENLRWIADYMYRSSYFYGRTGIHMGEVGWEWEMAEAHKLGMSVQAGLSRVGDAPNFGIGLMYAYSIGS